MPKRNLIWIAAILLAAMLIPWGMRNHWPSGGVNGWGTPSPSGHAARLIRENWLGEIDEDDLHRVALQAMVDKLDEHTSLMSPEAVGELARRLEGTVNGFGLALYEADGATVVAAPVFNSSAYHAGILPGDRIVAINGRPAESVLPPGWGRGGDSRPRAYAPLCSIYAAGEESGDEVELTIVRSGRQLPPVTLRRRKSPLETVTGLARGEDGRWIYAVDRAGQVAYIRISEFTNRSTADDLQRVMRELPHIRKLVVDVRDNPGGPLDVAVGIADMFLREGPIVTQLSAKSPPREYVAGKDLAFHPDVAVVVLINAGTASAAEIVAGALAYNARAVLVGEPTNGKRTIQEMLPLPGGWQLNLTTSRYVFGATVADQPPRPGLVGHQPIAPQAPVEMVPEQALELRRLRMVAALGPHTKAAHLLGGPFPRDLEPDPQTVLAELIEMDVQLREAADLLNSPEQMEEILEAARARKERDSAAAEARRR